MNWGRLNFGGGGYSIPFRTLKWVRREMEDGRPYDNLDARLHWSTE